MSLEWDAPIILSERDFALFTQAIENPPPVSARLKAAAAAYKAMRREHPEGNW